VICKDELGKKQPARMVTRSRNSPVVPNKKAPSTPMSTRKREIKSRQKEKENINMNQRSACKQEPSDEKKRGMSPI